MRSTGFHQRLLGAFLTLAAGCLFAQPGLPPRPSPGPAAAGLPYPPLTPSPVEIFRILLITNTAGREALLATKSAHYQEVLRTKIREYEAMTPTDREAKLQASQLQWYLPPLMKMKPADRAQRLASIPQPDRNLITQRLGLWGILPPQLQKDILENQTVIRLFVQPEASGPRPTLSGLSAGQQDEVQGQLDRWNQLPAARRDQILASFNKFFELRPEEKSRTLANLTAVEQAQMAKTLSEFGTLPKEDRAQAMEGFKKFAQLSPTERNAFLKTAERWRTMSEKDRETWRRIVARLQSGPPTQPPLPPAKSARLPAGAPQTATNN